MFFADVQSPKCSCIGHEHSLCCYDNIKKSRCQVRIVNKWQKIQNNIEKEMEKHGTLWIICYKTVKRRKNESFFKKGIDFLRWLC